ncbi:MAG: cysteine hydrolase [Acidobacteria bacterium]|nr:cysteine hydrolase [Acidobacteriota bacterium]
MASSQNKLVFVDVDTQADFVLPGGRLHVPGAEKLIPQWARLMRFAMEHNIPVISSADAHAPDDAEFLQFPPHCVRGTTGQRKIPETLLPKHGTIPNEPRKLGFEEEFVRAQQWIIEKQTFNLFTNVNATDLIGRIDAGQYVVFGVATDYCVKAAVEGLLDLRRRVSVVTDAIQGINAESSQAALDAWERAGARLVTTDQVLSQALAA